MNGKELKGFTDRPLKVDFDVKQKAKASYHTNMSDDGNVRFNKQIKKEEKGKTHRKETEKRKMAKFSGRGDFVSRGGRGDFGGRGGSRGGRY